MIKKSLFLKFFIPTAGVLFAITLLLAIVLQKQQSNSMRQESEAELNDHTSEVSTYLKISHGLLTDRIKAALNLLRETTLLQGKPSLGAVTNIKA